MTIPAHAARDDPTEFLATLLGDEPDGPISLYIADAATGERRTKWASTPAEAAQIATSGPPADVWVGVATRQARLPGNRRGTAADCLTIGALWVDIDVGTGQHARTDLPPDIAAGRTLLDQLPIPPSIVVETGGGLHAYWLLAERLDAQEARPLLARWGAWWAQQGERSGWHVDNVFNVDRVLRVPCTANRKTDPPKPVEIALWEPERTYGLDDIEQWLPDTPAAPTAVLADRLPYIGPERPGDAFNAAHSPSELLAAYGWTLHSRDRSGAEHWTRPGKEHREGHGATIYPDGWCHVYTDGDHRLEQGRNHDAYGLYVRFAHDGDFAAASTELRSRGYGAQAVDDLSWVSELIPGEEEGVTPIPWDTPYWPPAVQLPPFPVHALPDWMAEHVIASAERKQVPPDLCAMLAIGALAAVTVGRVEVALTADWREPLCLYLVAALASGDGKSPAEKAMVGALRRLERELIDQAAETVARAEMEQRIAAKRAKDRETAASGKSISSDEAWSATQDMLTAEPPPMPRLLVGDITPEMLAHLLSRHQGRLALVSTESELFSQATGVYSGGTPNIAVYLKGWSGDELIVDRKGGSGSPSTQVRVEAAHLTVALTTQVDTLRRLAGKPELEGQGFVQRFMFALPTSLVGRRDRRSQVREQGRMTTQATYDETFLRLGRRVASWEMTATVHCSAEAAEHYGEWIQRVEDRLHRDLHHLASWASKLTGSVARLAGLLHLADGHQPSPTDPLEASTMARAITVGEYWIAHAAEVWRLWDITDDGEMADVRKAIDWAADAEDETFTARELHTRMRTRMAYREVIEIAPLLEQLTEWHWIRPRDGAGYALGRRGTPSPVFEVHPEIEAARALRGQLSTEAVRHVRHADLYKGGSTTTTTTNTHTPPSLSTPTHVAHDAHDAQPAHEPDGHDQGTEGDGIIGVLL